MESNVTITTGLGLWWKKVGKYQIYVVQAIVVAVALAVFWCTLAVAGNDYKVVAAIVAAFAVGIAAMLFSGIVAALAVLMSFVIVGVLGMIISMIFSISASSALIFLVFADSIASVFTALIINDCLSDNEHKVDREGVIKKTVKLSYVVMLALTFFLMLIVIRH